jgi:hypothetical protein
VRAAVGFWNRQEGAVSSTVPQRRRRSSERPSACGLRPPFSGAARPGGPARPRAPRGRIRFHVRPLYPRAPTRDVQARLSQGLRRARAAPGFGLGACRTSAIRLLEAELIEARGVRLERQPKAAAGGGGRRRSIARSARVRKALTALGSAVRRGRRLAEVRAPLRGGLEAAGRCGAEPFAAHARPELYAAGGRPRREALSGPESLTRASGGWPTSRPRAGATATSLRRCLCPKTVEAPHQRLPQARDRRARGAGVALH